MAKDRNDKWVIREVDKRTQIIVKTTATLSGRTIAQQLKVIVDEWYAKSGLSLPLPTEDSND